MRCGERLDDVQLRGTLHLQTLNLENRGIAP
jgi:hypothetical protein